MNAKGKILRSRYATPNQIKSAFNTFKQKYYVGKLQNIRIYSTQYDCIKIFVIIIHYTIPVYRTDINTNEQWLKDVMVVIGDCQKGNAKGYHPLSQPQ